MISGPAFQKLRTLSPNQYKEEYTNWFDPLRSYLCYRGADEETATDLVQEVFVKVWGKRDKFDPPIKSLLYKMVSDKWVDWCRKYGQMKVVRGENHETMDSHDPQRAMESEEAREVMKKALEDLPESQRSVFLMNRLEGLTYSEIQMAHYAASQL